MATPVTEIGFFTIIADANIAKALDDIETIALREPGIRNLRWGRFEGDERRVLLIARMYCEDMAFHKQYEQTPIDYPTLVGILTPCAGFVEGPVTEAIAQDVGGEQKLGPAHFVVVGWESADAPTSALAERAGSWAIAIPNAGGVEVYYVRFGASA